MVGTKRTMFFQKVCQLVSLMASPKQPQSSTLLVRASMKVVQVKKHIINSSTHAVILRYELVISITPMVNSMMMSTMLSVVAIGVAHRKLRLPTLQLVMYSVILYEVPKGSTPLTKPEKMNTMPTKMRHTALMIRLVLLSFMERYAIVVCYLVVCSSVMRIRQKRL